MHRLRCAMAAALLALAVSAHAGGKGHLGINVAIEGEGPLWNPTVKAAKVAKVSPGSAAEQAGIRAGDHIVEIEGRQVAGAKASDLQPYMQREVGQSVKLLIRRPSGEIKSISLVAGPKPE